MEGTEVQNAVRAGAGSAVWPGGGSVEVGLVGPDAKLGSADGERRVSPDISTVAFSAGGDGCRDYLVVLKAGERA